MFSGVTSGSSYCLFSSWNLNNINNINNVAFQPYGLRPKIDGAKNRCMAMPETHVRPSSGKTFNDAYIYREINIDNSFQWINDIIPVFLENWNVQIMEPSNSRAKLHPSSCIPSQEQCLWWSAGVLDHCPGNRGENRGIQLRGKAPEDI